MAQRQPDDGYTFTGEVRAHAGMGSWHFVTLPEDVSDEIADRAATGRTAFGSVRVEVTVGATRWSTSLFPDKAAGAYVLPVKKPVRVAESLVDGDRVTIHLTLVDARPR